MKKHDADFLFKKMANGYVDVYGGELKKEMEDMQRTGAAEPDAQNNVVRRIKAKSKARVSGVLGVLAACIVLAVAIPAVLDRLSPMFDAVSTSTTDEAAAEAVMEEATAGEAESWDYAMEEAAPAAGSAAEQPAADAGGAQQYDIIPLNATLPDNFTVSAVEQDVARTIYYIDDANEDNVVLTLEDTEGQALEVPEDLDVIMINGVETYGKYRPDYSVLMFEQDGIEYVLTCKYDMNTLMELGEAILI